jgi:hypothetical protein
LTTFATTIRSYEILEQARHMLGNCQTTYGTNHENSPNRGKYYYDYITTMLPKSWLSTLLIKQNLKLLTVQVIKHPLEIGAGHFGGCHFKI